jgi:hypothetical protein
VALYQGEYCIDYSVGGLVSGRVLYWLLCWWPCIRGSTILITLYQQSNQYSTPWYKATNRVINTVLPLIQGHQQSNQYSTPPDTRPPTVIKEYCIDYSVGGLVSGGVLYWLLCWWPCIRGSTILITLLVALYQGEYCIDYSGLPIIGNMIWIKSNNIFTNYNFSIFKH